MASAVHHPATTSRRLSGRAATTARCDGLATFVREGHRWRAGSVRRRERRVTGAAVGLRAALDRYQLATSAPRTAWGFQSRWRTVRGVTTHDRCSLGARTEVMPLAFA